MSDFVAATRCHLFHVGNAVFDAEGLEFRWSADFQCWEVRVLRFGTWTTVLVKP